MSTDAYPFEPANSATSPHAPAGDKTPAPAGSRSRVISRPDRHEISAVPWMQNLLASPASPVDQSAPPERAEPADRAQMERAQAEQLLSKVKDLEARLEQTQLQHQQQLRDASQRARQETEKEAQTRLEHEVHPWLLRMAKTVEDLMSTKRLFLEDTEEQVVRLAVAIARRILYREIQVDPEALLGLLRAALAKSELREVHRILLHPLDKQALAPFLQRMDLPQRLEVVGDNSLERGALLVESTTGLLDASVSAQLDEVERGFVDLMGRRA